MEPWETVQARLIATGKWRLPTQGELNNSNAALEGQTIHVAGLGEGKVVKFLKNGGWGVHSAHTIDFSSPAFDGSDVREVKLKRKSNNETEWLKAVTEVRPRKTFSVTAAVVPPHFCMHTNDHLTKTGSGQTQGGNTRKQNCFLADVSRRRRWRWRQWWRRWVQEEASPWYPWPTPWYPRSHHCHLPRGPSVEETADRCVNTLRPGSVGMLVYAENDHFFHAQTRSG